MLLIIVCNVHEINSVTKLSRAQNLSQIPKLHENREAKVSGSICVPPEEKRICLNQPRHKVLNFLWSNKQQFRGNVILNTMVTGQRTTESENSNQFPD